MIDFYKVMRILVIGLISMISLIACKQDQIPITVESLEIYEVEGDDNSKKPTSLSYKEVKFYNANGYLTQQHFYSVDNKMKGFEVIRRDGNNAVSNYYNMDSTILAIYHIELDGINEISRQGYDGQTKEHLRTEIYTYDSAGNRTGKEIRTKAGDLSRKFVFSYDSDRNQTGLSILNQMNEVLREEKYQVLKRDEQNRWLEKWGYLDDKPNSFHRRILK